MMTSLVVNKTFACIFPFCSEHKLPATEVFVPPLPWLYAVERDIISDSLQELLQEPLSLNELRKHVRCEFHAKGSAVGLDYNRRRGIDKMHCLAATDIVLARAIERNAEQMELERKRRRDEERAARQNQPHRHCQSEMDRIFAKAQLHHEHHKHGKRTAEARRLRALSKNSREPKPEKGNKKKSGNGKDKNKRKR